MNYSRKIMRLQKSGNINIRENRIIVSENPLVFITENNKLTVPRSNQGVRILISDINNIRT